MAKKLQANFGKYFLDNFLKKKQADQIKIQKIPIVTSASTGNQQANKILLNRDTRIGGGFLWQSASGVFTISKKRFQNTDGLAFYPLSSLSSTVYGLINYNGIKFNNPIINLDLYGAISAGTNILFNTYGITANYQNNKIFYVDLTQGIAFIESISGGTTLIGDVTGSLSANSVTGIRGIVVSPSAPTITQVLTYDGSKWTPSGITQGGGVLAGDVTGAINNNSVTAIRGFVISPTAPTATQALTYDGNKYTPSAIISNIIGASGTVTLVNGSVISVGIQNAAGDITGSITANSVTAIRGVVISPTAPTITQVLTYDGTKWSPSGTSNNPLTLVGDVTGFSNSNSVTAIRGNWIDPTAPSNGDVFFYKGDSWTHGQIAGDVTGSITSMAVNKIKGIAVSAMAAVNNQILVYNASNNAYTMTQQVLSGIRVSQPSITATWNLTHNLGTCSLAGVELWRVIGGSTSNLQGAAVAAINLTDINNISVVLSASFAGYAVITAFYGAGAF